MNLSRHYLSDQHQIVLAKIVRGTSNIGYNQTSSITIDQLEEVSRTSDAAKDGAEALNENTERLRIEANYYQSVLQPIIQELPTIKKSSDEQNAFVDDMKTNQQTVEQDILTMKEQFEDMQSANHDGMFTWKITNVKEKMGE